jgi:membrane protease YdiL (CAAX protease family)
MPRSANREPYPPRRVSPRVWQWGALGMALVIAYCIGPLIARHVSLASVHDNLAAITRDWILVAILAVIGLVGQQRSAEFFGLRVPLWRDFAAMLGVFVATAALVVLVSGIPAVQVALRRISNPDFMRVPFDVRLALVLTAGICEEFIFRGFVIEQIAEWTGSLSLGAGISLLLFVVPHAWLYGFTAGLAIPALLGASLTLLYVWRRNLPVCMLMHAMMDGYSLLLVPALMRAHAT